MAITTLLLILLQSWLSNLSLVKTAAWVVVFLVSCLISILIYQSSLPIRIRLMGGLPFAMGISFYYYLDPSHIMPEWSWRTIGFVPQSILLAFWLGLFFRGFSKVYFKRLRYPHTFKSYLHSGISPVLIFLFIIYFLLFTSRWSIHSFFFFTLFLMNPFCEFLVLVVRKILQLFRVPLLNQS